MKTPSSRSGVNARPTARCCSGFRLRFNESWIVGTVASGKASFNGTNQYVALPSAPFGNYTSGSTYSLSFETWFNAPAGAGGVILSQNGGNATPGGAAPAGWVHVVAIGTDGRLRSSLFWHGDTNARLASATAVNDGHWHHVAVTYAGGVESLYLDGTLVGQQSAGEVSYAGSYTYFLGTGRWVKEVGLAYELPDDPLPRLTRELKRRTFPPALFAMLVAMASLARTDTRVWWSRISSA